MEEARRGFGPAIISCAVNGGVQGKQSHDALPETPEEIAAQAGEAYDAGAAIAHIHQQHDRRRSDIYYSRGRRFRGNGEAVERAVRIVGELNREVATPAQARELLGLPATPRAHAAGRSPARAGGRNRRTV